MGDIDGVRLRLHCFSMVYWYRATDETGLLATLRGGPPPDEESENGRIGTGWSAGNTAERGDADVGRGPGDAAAEALGWGDRRIARELGCSHMTVHRHLAQGGWVAYRVRGRPRTLTGLEEWTAERFRRHAGNTDVVRQELEREKGDPIEPADGRAGSSAFASRTGGGSAFDRPL
jgi:hypothetical protein